MELACLVSCGVVTGFGVAIRHAHVEIGSSVVVIGCGGVGLNVIQACFLAGATQIIAIDPTDAKRKLATRFGATDVVNPRNEDVQARVLKITDGLGAQYAFEVVGMPSTLRQAYDCTAAGGLVVSVGLAAPGQEVSFPATDFGKRKTVTWASAGAASPWRDLPILIDLYRAGRWNLEDLLSTVRPLVEVNAAFDDMKAGLVARTVLTFGGN